MKTRQRDEIKKHLRDSGREICAIEDYSVTPSSVAWFLVELWQIRSRWTPVGAELFISFVLDPQHEYPLKNRWSAVWLVIGSRQRPVSWNNQDDEIGLLLGKGWHDNLPAFISGLSNLRNLEVTMNTQFDKFDEQFFHATDEQTA